MSFLQREVTSLGRNVFRLGLAGNFGIDERSVSAALERGVNYIFYTNLRTKGLRDATQAAIKRDRSRYVIATGPSLGFFGGSVRRSAERALKKLGTDYIDVFQLFWLGVGSAFTDATIRELQHLKESGKVRAIGVSIHDRERAGKLAADSPLDLLMIRYNAAHPGAERDIFPHLEKRKPAIVAYTATRWRKLLKRPSGWQGRVPTAGDCYRFCLSSPHVDVVLCGPSSAAELDENLAELEKGPLSEQDNQWMREFGKVVHG